MEIMTKNTPVSQQLVVVLGMHRSGTSAITRGLQTVGISLGDRLMPAIQGVNDKGFWEDLDIVHFNDELLEACGRKWHSLDPVQPVEFENLYKKNFQIRAIDILRRKLAENAIFGFKDPRIVKLLPFWQQVFNAGKFNVSYILALRNPVSIQNSLAKRDGFDPEKSYYLWIEHMLAMIECAGKAKSIFVDYDLLMQFPDLQLQRVAHWLDAKIQPEALNDYCEKFLDEKLRHAKFTATDIDLDLSVPQLVREINSVAFELSNDTLSVDELLSSGRLVTWQSEFTRLKPALQLVDRISLKMESVGKRSDESEWKIRELIDQTASLMTHAATKEAENIQLKQTLETLQLTRKMETAASIEHVKGLTSWAESSETYAKAKANEAEQLKQAMEKLLEVQSMETSAFAGQIEELRKNFESSVTFSKEKEYEMALLNDSITQLRVARERESISAVEQIERLEIRAGRSEAYAKEKELEAEQLKQSIEEFQLANSIQSASSSEQIAALKSWAESSDAYAKDKANETELLKQTIERLKHDLAYCKKFWFFKLFPPTPPKDISK